MTTSIPAVSLSSHATWPSRFDDLQEFVQRHGRLPSRLSGQPERTLATWLANQRQSLQTRTLNTDRVAQLDAALPDWKGRDHNAAWESHLQNVAAWKASHGRWPSATTDSEEESQIGSWLATQRAAAANGSVSEDRAERLNALLPGWATTTIFDDNWKASLAELSEYRAKHGRLPRQSASDPNVRALAVWVSRQRGRAKDGTLTADRRAQLDRLLSGWDWTGGNREPNH